MLKQCLYILIFAVSFSISFGETLVFAAPKQSKDSDKAANNEPAPAVGKKEAIRLLKEMDLDISNNGFRAYCEMNPFQRNEWGSISSRNIRDKEGLIDFLKKQELYQQTLNLYLELGLNVPLNECLDLHLRKLNRDADLKIIQLLINKGVKPNYYTTEAKIGGVRTGSYYHSPLARAIDLIDDRYGEALFATDKDSLEYSSIKEKFLHHRFAESIEIFKLLLSKADMKTYQVKGREGANCLIGSAMGWKNQNYKLITKEIIEPLVKKGVNINSACENGITPIVRAFQSKDIEMMKILIDHGADVNTRVPIMTNLGMGIYKQSGWEGSLLYVAEKEGLLEIAEFLKEHGAKSIKGAGGAQKQQIKKTKKK